MKKVQKFKAVYENGKETQKEAVGKPNSFMDSIAEGVLIESENLVKRVQSNKRVKETIEVYEEVKSAPKKVATKK